MELNIDSEDELPDNALETEQLAEDEVSNNEQLLSELYRLVCI